MGWSIAYGIDGIRQFIEIMDDNEIIDLSSKVLNFILQTLRHYLVLELLISGNNPNKEAC